jgi:transposase
VRRRFYELAAAGPAPIASEALQQIAGSMRIETTSAAAAPMSGVPFARRRAGRSSMRSSPGCASKLELISQKTKLAEAIRYALSRWQGLTRFLDDGRIEIDSNVVERSIRPIALNRKNALFAGSDGGGEHWAVIASLIETCKLNALDPQHYLTDVITKIVNGHPNSQIDDLLPWAYPAAPALSDVA